MKYGVATGGKWCHDRKARGVTFPPGDIVVLVKDNYSPLKWYDCDGRTYSSGAILYSMTLQRLAFDFNWSWRDNKEDNRIKEIDI